ncbi:3'-5' exonuclease [Mucilaginibacter terrae]|uniref:Superfamily I DNA/RNA helicase n=1 Tax=Mucilaginibacter terrae TaxID=1955052 RepID=A0ABU3GX02_9SPHI|nr:3'-5' exonuclease [Mucilaginibacter terrae]MDT3404289.1 superfamily I DNA/RNA helicase [Mucilaginibacter terrae]
MPFYFKLPLYTDMTPSQMSVLDETEPVAITGGPGTGKSVVSLWRHIRNHSIGKRKSTMITYTKTLEIYLASCAAAENVNAGNSVTRIYQWGPGKGDHEIIIDEAQDIEEHHHQRIRAAAQVVSYGADDQQILYPDKASSQQQLKTVFSGNQEYELDENFRNSYEIMCFTQAALPQRRISAVMMRGLKANRSTNIKPKCMLVNSSNQQIETILDIIEEFHSQTHNIGILVPLGRHVDELYELLKLKNVKCTKYRSSTDELTHMENVHVTTYKSSKGIEFDTVILPDFQDWQFNKVRYNITLKDNDYYVAFTRTKRNLFLISTTSNLNIDQNTFDIEKV